MSSRSSHAHIVLTHLLLALLGLCGGLDNGLGLSPPMGFNTWNYFGCNVTEQVVLDAAHALVALGLKNVGACARAACYGRRTR